MFAIAVGAERGGEGYTFAYTSFEEPPGGSDIKYYDTDDETTDHQLLNHEHCEPLVEWTATGLELGYTAWYFTTGGEGLTDGDYVGVTDYTGAVQEYPDGVHGYQMSDIDGIMQVIFDTVTDSGGGDWSVGFDIFVSDADWETDDAIIVDVVVDGGTVISIFDTTGQDIDGLEIDGLEIEGEWLPLQLDLTDYTEATLRISLESSEVYEAIFFDRVAFRKHSFQDADGDGVPDSLDNCDLSNPDQADCNGDGIGDACDINDGTALDCDGNGVPDECEPDCNGNGTADACDIDDGTSLDCNGNGTPDECEPDCNGNGVADACDISDGLSTDLDADGQPDECGSCTGDINRDDQVDVEDLLEVIANWGTCEPGRMRGDSAGLLDRSSPADVRVMTWNTPFFQPYSMSETEFEPYANVLRAIDADVIVFQEFEHDEDVAALGGWLDEHVRAGSWQIHEGAHDAGEDRNVIASCMPLDMLATNTIPGPLYPLRGVTMARVDCPDEYWSTDLYLMGVHLKAYSDCLSILKKQDAADSIANWIGDLRTPGGAVDLPQDTLVVLLGDTNFYTEGDQPERTLLTGDILNEARYGPDIKGDWDESDLVDLKPMQPGSGDTWTWWASDDFDASRTDRVIVTNSVMQRHNSFTLNTTVLPEDVLDAYGLELDDTTREVTSDHLPVVVDFRDPQYCVADLNHDGSVGVEDLLLVIANWNNCP